MARQNELGQHHHVVQERPEKAKKGQQLNGFFTPMLEDKEGVPHNLKVAEIEAEVSAMSKCGRDSAQQMQPN